MAPSISAILCRYRYDPLDRLASTQSAAQDSALRFYRKNRLATQIQGAIQYSVFGHDDRLLAQQQRSGQSTETSLLATDLQGSVLHGVDGADIGSRTYTVYGHSPSESGLSCLMGFNAEQRDPVTGHYLLGNGYRAFNPVLMRFNSPDSLSPFDEGGFNTYAYCQGDPVNFRDSTGKAPVRFLFQKPAGMLSKTIKPPLQKTMAVSKKASLRSMILDDVADLQLGVPDTQKTQAEIVSRLSPHGKVDANIWASNDLQLTTLSKEQLALKVEQLSGMSRDSQLLSRLADRQGFISGYKQVVEAVKNVREVSGHHARDYISSGVRSNMYKTYSKMVPIIDKGFVEYNALFIRRYGPRAV